MTLVEEIRDFVLKEACSKEDRSDEALKQLEGAREGGAIRLPTGQLAFISLLRPDEADLWSDWCVLCGGVPKRFKDFDDWLASYQAQGQADRMDANAEGRKV